MKTKSLACVGILFGMTAVSGAFTLDFSGVASGTTLPPNPLTISVPGYGSVQFDAQAGSLVVNSSQTDGGLPTPSLVFDRGDTVRVTFVGLAPTDLSSTAVGLNPGESFTFLDSSNPNVFFYQLNGNTGAQAGLKSLSWTAVPEPSTALLGVLGSALLVIRRRR